MRFSNLLATRPSLTESDWTRNQEKGVLAKGVSVESSVTAKETKNTQVLAPAVHLALRAPQPREAYILQKPLLKPLFLVPDWIVGRSTELRGLHEVKKM